MADSFVKLWASILDSSVWSTPLATRVVWVAMLAMADENGFVGASSDGIARRANVSIEDAERAIETLSAPDDRSRSEAEDGRRIRKVDRGWHIINHGYFKDLRDKEARREYERRRKAEYRARIKEESGTDAGHSETDQDKSQMSAKEEAYASEDEDAYQSSTPPTPPEGGAKKRRKRKIPGYTEDFLRFWEAYGRKGTKALAFEEWQKLPDEDDHEEIIRSAAKWLSAFKPDRIQFLVDGERFLKRRKWEDEIPERGESKTTGQSGSRPQIMSKQVGHGDFKDGWD